LTEEQNIMAKDLTTVGRSGSLLERGFEGPLHSLHWEMNRLFHDIFHGRSSHALQAGLHQPATMMPSVDVSETDREMRISVDLPGVRESDIGVSLVDDILTIRAEKALEKTDEKANYHIAERSYGSFLRALRLPYSVDSDKIQADFDNGVLTVTLPVCKDKERSRKIQVQSGRAQVAAPSSEQANSVVQTSPPQGGPPNKTK
jgi:HSP20 family protein